MPIAAQSPPKLIVSPAQATLLIGGTQTFRAVGVDGRIRHSVHWSLAPDYAAKLVVNADEVTVEGAEATSRAVLTASVDGDSADATIEIPSGHTMANGTRLWTVAALPGCTSKKMTQAVPSANGPDLYDEEECPQGAFVRALTSDGREMWRRQITGTGGVLAKQPAPKPQAETVQHLNLHRASVCDGVSPGMSKDAVSKVVNAHNLHVEKSQWQSDRWEFEEEGSRCDISFDGKSGTVAKKTKTIIAE
jgi:hypothetical protein